MMVCSIRIKHRSGDRGYAGFFRQHHADFGIRALAQVRIRKILEESALRRQGLEYRGIQRAQEEISFPAVKFRKNLMTVRAFQVIGQGILGRRKRTESNVLVYFTELARQVFRGQAVAGLPAGDMIGFSKGIADESALPQHRAMAKGKMTKGFLNKKDNAIPRIIDPVKINTALAG